MVKRCLFCGRYFTPDYRIKDKQKSCGRPQCAKARKKAAQKEWVKNNPGYFDHMYETYIKPWRKKQPMIKDEIPTHKPLQRLVIIIPDDTHKMIKDTITLRRVGIRTFAAHGYG